MNISLIKQLNENIREKDEYELALEKAGLKSNPVKESIDDYDMDDEDLSDIDGEFAGDEFDDIRMVNAYAPRHEYTRQGTSTGMNDDELERSIAADTAGYGDDPESLLIKRQEVKDRLRDIDDRPTANIDRDPTGAPTRFENEEGAVDPMLQKDIENGTLDRLAAELGADASQEMILDALEQLDYPNERVMQQALDYIMNIHGDESSEYTPDHPDYIVDPLADGPQVDDYGNEYIP